MQEATLERPAHCNLIKEIRVLRASLMAVLLAVASVSAPVAVAQVDTYYDAQGLDCVRSGEQYTEPTYGGGTRYYWVLHNRCSQRISVIADLSVVDQSNTTHNQTQRLIEGHGQVALSCSYDPNAVRISCNGFTGRLQVN